MDLIAKKMLHVNHKFVPTHHKENLLNSLYVNQLN